MDSIEKNKQEMLDRQIWVVIGVTPNREKYGYKIWKKLKENNYEVYGINPKYNEIENEKCYSTLKELPVKPQVVDFVVPPSVSSKYVDEANELGIEYLWFQPGTVDGDVIDKAEGLGMKIVFHDCVLVALA